MLTDNAHVLTWLIYLSGLALGLLVLGHLLQGFKRPFVRVLLRAIYLGVLLAPVATDSEKMFYAPAIMHAALSIVAGKVDESIPALMSMGTMTLLALSLALAYYLLVLYNKKHA